jgi:phosphotransferase system HPr (HPr) family protein
MLSSQIIVTNDLGLHARAAAQLVKGIAEFKSSINLSRSDSDRSADARSILSILTLAATKGTLLDIVVEGVDESDALAALEELFESGFGEANVITK